MCAKDNPSKKMVSLLYSLFKASRYYLKLLLEINVGMGLKEAHLLGTNGLLG